MPIQNFEKVWPEWHLEQQLGKGAFGVVYQAVRKEHNVESHAAIKVISIPADVSEVNSLRSDGLGLDATKTYLQGLVSDFVGEIQMMESLKGTQNIVSVEDYKVVEREDEIGWDIYIRMELLTPFNTYASNKKLTEAEVIKLGCDICTALEICGKRNIIHRDIKPENIFVNDFGHFKLGDFGIARKLENTTGGLSQKGTFNYMAPEVVYGTAYDAKVDTYSLGIVLYRLLNGNRLPFLDDEQKLLSPAERKSAVERRIRGEALPDPRDATPRMANLILRACAYDPKWRFASATEMKEALNSITNGTYRAVPRDYIQPPKGSRAANDGDKTVFLGDAAAVSGQRNAQTQPSQAKPSPQTPLTQGKPSPQTPLTQAKPSPQTPLTQAKPLPQTSLTQAKPLPQTSFSQVKPLPTMPSSLQGAQTKKGRKEAPKKEKKKKSAWKGILVAVLLLAIGGAGLAFFLPGTGLLISPEEKLEKYLSQADSLAAEHKYVEALALLDTAEKELDEDAAIALKRQAISKEKENYSLQQYLDKVDELAAKEEYQEALAMLDQAENELGTRTQITTKRLEMRSAKDLYAIQPYFDRVDQMMADNKYNDALAALKEAEELVGANDAITAKRQDVETASKQHQLQEYIDKADGLVAQNKYSEALAILETAMQLLGQNDTITAKHQEIKKARVLYTLSTYEASGDYASAVRYINSELGAFDNDSDVVSKANPMKVAYRQKSLDEAEALLASDGYREAVNRLNEALTLLPDDEALTAQLGKYAEYAPVPIGNVTTVTRADGYVAQTAAMTDILQNSYEQGNLYSASGGQWLLYLRNGYSTLKGTVAKYSTNSRKSYLYIYANNDGENASKVQLYSAALNDAAEPVPVSVDISGYKYLYLEVSTDYGSAANLLLVDFEFEK